MRRLAVAAAMTVGLAHAPAHAFFFFFIPGGLTDKLTGAEGENCVTENAKVGETISVQNRGPGVIRSLSGTSMRCLDKRYPIRALIDFTAQPPPPAPVAVPVVAPVAAPEPVAPVEVKLPPKQAPQESPQAADRLRALNKLVEDGLITRDDYEAKKKEILSTM